MVNDIIIFIYSLYQDSVTTSMDQGLTQAKAPESDYFGLLKSSVETTHLCCSMKAAIDHMEINKYSYVPIKLYLQIQAVDWFLPVDHSL